VRRHRSVFQPDYVLLRGPAVSTQMMSADMRNSRVGRRRTIARAIALGRGETRASTHAWVRRKATGHEPIIIVETEASRAHNRARTAEAVGARLTFTKLRQWPPPREPSVTIPTSLTGSSSMVGVARAARMSWTQACGVTVVAYLLVTGVVAIGGGVPPLMDGPTAHVAGTDQRTVVPRGCRARASRERASDVPDLHIDRRRSQCWRGRCATSTTSRPKQPTYRQQAVDCLARSPRYGRPCLAPEAPALNTSVPEALSPVTR